MPKTPQILSGTLPGSSHEAKVQFQDHLGSVRGVFEEASLSNQLGSGVQTLSNSSKATALGASECSEGRGTCPDMLKGKRDWRAHLKVRMRPQTAVSEQGSRCLLASPLEKFYKFPGIPLQGGKKKRNPTPPHLQGFCCLLYYSLTLRMWFS